MRRYKAAESDNGARADIFIAGKYPGFSRSALAALFENGNIKLHGRPVKPSYRLQAGQSVNVDDSLLYQKPPAIKLPVIYEDKDVFVIDKPAGVLTHSKGPLNREPTVASFIADKLTDKIPLSNRAGIVHRLDRATSGVIITARSAAALNWLQKQFSKRKVKKTYITIVEGVPDPPQAIIDAPIARNPRKPQTFMVSPLGRLSQTEYRVVESFQKNGRRYSRLELNPLSGRTHQLRVHLAYLGHPIVGDPVYGRSGGNMLLHAYTLEITLPSHERRVFKASLPRRFKEFLND